MLKILKKNPEKEKIAKAVSQELIRRSEELSEVAKKPNATTRHLRDYPVSDTDVAKPVKYGTHPSQRVDPRTGKKYVPPKSPLGQDVEEGVGGWSGPLYDPDLQGTGKKQRYEMMFKNGQVKRFSAMNDNEARKIAAGHGARSVIRMKGNVPGDKIGEQGVAEGSDRDMSDMEHHQKNVERFRKDLGLPDRDRPKKDRETDMDHHRKNADRFRKDLGLDKKKGVVEASVFPYKPPRKGSVAYNALMRQKEQDKKRVKEIEAIGTKNHHIGVAKVTKEEASPMIKPPKNEFGKKEDAFAHAKQHGGKVMKKTFTHPTSGTQTVSYVVKEDIDQLDEITLGNYKEKAENEVKELKPHAKGEYGDFAKKILAKRKAGLQRAMKREDVNNEAYMGKVTTVSNPREKWMKSVKDRGYDMRAGAKRLQDLLDKQKKERAEMEQRAKEKGLEY